MPCLMLNGRNYTGGGSGGAVFDGLDWDNATTLTLPDYTGYEYTPPCEGVLMSTSYGSVGGTVVKRTGYDDVFMSYRDDTWSTAWVPVTTATYTLKRASSSASYPNDSWLKFIPWKVSGGSGSAYNYSTTEHKVGTWTDGSDIYEVTLTNIQLSSQNTTVDLSTYNPYIILDYEGYCELPDHSVNRMFPYYNNGSYYANVYYLTASKELHIVSEGYLEYSNVVLTIRYIKASS